MFGGAAGPGKSSALLMGATEYVDVPGYRALILRRTIQDLRQAGALLDRANEWFRGTGAKWEASEMSWRFPSGAKIAFGYLASENAKFRYGSTEYQYIAFDEVSHFTESQYTFLFSRLRQSRDIGVPLRMRAASNPGGPGHLWVRNRFISDQAADDIRADQAKSIYAKRSVDGEIAYFVPAKLRDNPSVDEQDYKLSLNKLDPVTRAQLLRGDWLAAPDGVIKLEWIRFWDRTPNQEQYRCWVGPNRYYDVPISECRRFSIIDAAATSDEVAAADRDGRHSWSVISTFDWHRQLGFLIWLDVQRGLWGMPELKAKAKEVFERQQPAYIGIEDEKTGRALAQEMRNFPLRLLKPNTDKLTRASRALNMLDEGKVFLAKGARWTNCAMEEMVAWRGTKTEQTDQIDTLSYGALEAYRPELVAYAS